MDKAFDRFHDNENEDDDKGNISSPSTLSNISMDCCVSNKKIDVKEWINRCKNSLISMESNNIQIRAARWNTMIRIQTEKVNQSLNINTNEHSNYYQYKYKLNNPLIHLKFLTEWKGLKMNQIKQTPKSYLEFEQKAKSWLNGRRAPNYGKTLFPEMINSAQQYAESISGIIFKGNKSNRKMLYQRLLIYGYLYCLCSARVLINHLSNKTYFLCENSVKSSKSETCKILQKYASDHPYPKQFPSHRKEACDYFHKKYNENLSLLLQSINGNNNNINNINIINNNNNSMNNVNHINNMNMNHINLNHIDQNILQQFGNNINNNSNTSNLVFMTLPKFSQLINEIQNVKMLQIQQENYIHQLLIKMNSLQSQLDNLNNADSNCNINNINNSNNNQINNMDIDNNNNGIITSQCKNIPFHLYTYNRINNGSNR